MATLQAAVCSNVAQLSCNAAASSRSSSRSSSHSVVARPSRLSRPDGDFDRLGFCTPSCSSDEFHTTAAILRPRIHRGRSRQKMTFTTNALPVDTYWITVFQAVGVSVLMAVAAVISGIVINIGIEVKAVRDFIELDKKGEFREEDYELVPDEDFGGFESEEALYLFTNKDLSGNRPARNRPVRDLQEAELQEVKSDK
ncbi:hypothetical protein R1sor_005932 [Riccia sorocarpa]|uniref:Ammonium transporter AmtB-like domain-containing protein n=1 Tax=Riccia sorocarpa TaxID=122646 RepID=A0ABD3HN07_9MARC